MCKIVRVDDSDAIGRFSQRAQGRVPGSEARPIFDEPYHRVRVDAGADARRRNDVLVEDREAARVDRIEGGIRAVCFVQDRAELLCIVEL